MTAVIGSATSVIAQTITRGETYAITRATAPIVIDGRLDDAGWRDAVRIEHWYEVDPGDNTEPQVRSVGYLTYDKKFIYAGFEFDDPDPKRITAPYSDRDDLASTVDFGGLFIDTRNEGHTAYEFQVSAHNIQYDAIMDDNGSGQNASPDFFWNSAARINDHGWTLEIRIPFSTLRYPKLDPQTWGIILYRNYARDFRRQIASVMLPRGSQCLVCREGSLTGLSGLPAGGHLIAAPYLTAAQTALPFGEMGTPLVDYPLERKVGLDVKYMPNAANVIDGTLRPDFSQIEADTAQISTNRRFALFYPEKRPFFLEGVEWLATPIQAVYTRTITAPDWGARATGKISGVSYTALVTKNAGGGRVVVPGPNASSLAPEDFLSTVFIGRAKRDFGLSFISALATDRESGVDGHNRVIGPDFQVRWHGTETFTGQVLVSDTTTPNRPGANSAWTGRSLTSGAAQVTWTHNTTHYDAQVLYKDFGADFRADSGFVPQVGYREMFGSSGWTFRPTGFFRRVRSFINLDTQHDRTNDALIDQSVLTGLAAHTRWNGVWQVQYLADRIRAGAETFPRHQVQFYQRISPSRHFVQLGVDGNVGQEVDFANGRLGRGGGFNGNATVYATDHLALDLIATTTWLHVADNTGVRDPLFTARVNRLRANYAFTARSFVRLIGQYVSTDRDPALYLQPTSAHDGFFSGSLLFAYKITWQSVMFVGYGDDRTLDQRQRLQRFDRQVFVKLSYAFQR